MKEIKLFIVLLVLISFLTLAVFTLKIENTKLIEEVESLENAYDQLIYKWCPIFWAINEYSNLKVSVIPFEQCMWMIEEMHPEYFK